MQTENNLILDVQHFADSDYNAESSFRYKYFLIIAKQQMISIVADIQLNRIVSFKSFTNHSASFLDLSYNELNEFIEINKEFLFFNFLIGLSIGFFLSCIIIFFKSALKNK